SDAEIPIHRCLPYLRRETATSVPARRPDNPRLGTNGRPHGCYRARTSVRENVRSVNVLPGPLRPPSAFRDLATTMTAQLLFGPEPVVKVVSVLRTAFAIQLVRAGGHFLFRKLSDVCLGR